MITGVGGAGGGGSIPTGTMTYKGALSFLFGGNYPAATQGDTYSVSNAGTVGSGPWAEVGDLLVCITTGASGDNATVGSHWKIVQGNLTRGVSGPNSTVTGDAFAQWDGTSGALIKSGVTLDTDITLAADSDSVLASQHATKTYVDVAVAGAGAPPNDTARAENSSNISIPNATPTALTFDTQIFDTTGIFDAGGDTSKITFVKSGYYTVGGEADLSIGAGRRIIYIQKNGSSIIALNDYTNGSVGIEHRCINGIDHFTAGDYIQVLVYQENGSSINVLGGSFRTPAIWAHILSAG